MGGIFSLDGPISRVCSRIADIWLLNFIFVITCIPIVTIGASLTALHAMSMKMLMGNEGYIVRGFLKIWKQNLKQATILYVVFAAAGAVVCVDLYVWMGIENGIGRMMAVISTAIGFVYLFGLIYVFAYQAVFDNPVSRTIKNAFIISFQKLPCTLVLLALYMVVIFFNFNFMVVNIFMLLYGFGLVAMGSAVMYHLAFRDYIQEAKEKIKE